VPLQRVEPLGGQGGRDAGRALPDLGERATAVEQVPDDDRLQRSTTSSEARGVSSDPAEGEALFAARRLEVGPEVLALHRAVKEAFDPDGMLNPGKKVG
jgi:FAD/FMN-containing dehydrogenase